jgi:hypothetical protein
MTTSERLRSALVLVPLLVLAGCGDQSAKQSDANPAAASPAAGTQPYGPVNVRSGVGKLLPSVQRGAAELDLQNIAKLYAADLLTENAPKKVEDLKGLDPRVVKAVKDGEYVVVWNAAPATSLSAVIAYERDVPKQGGMVAKLDGSVTKMTPKEYETAPKATGR